MDNHPSFSGTANYHVWQSKLGFNRNISLNTGNCEQVIRKIVADIWKTKFHLLLKNFTNFKLDKKEVKNESYKLIGIQFGILKEIGQLKANLTVVFLEKLQVFWKLVKSFKISSSPILAFAHFKCKHYL